MLRYDPKAPIEPFYVPAKVLKCTAGAPEQPVGGSPKPKHDLDWAQLDSLTGKAVGAVVLAAAYFGIQHNPALGAVTVLLLLGALLYRLDGVRRRIVLAPLVLSMFRLANQINTGLFTANFRSFVRQAIPTIPMWLPLFLAACLFFGPSFRTVTETVIMAFSFLLLLSGLLPGEGYRVVFEMMEYLIFIATGIAMIVDMIKPAPRAVARQH